MGLYQSISEEIPIVFQNIELQYDNIENSQIIINIDTCFAYNK